MLIGMVRLTETRELTAEGESLEAIAEAFRGQTPEGWELLSSPVTMPKGTSTMTAAGRAAASRRGGGRRRSQGRGRGG